LLLLLLLLVVMMMMMMMMMVMVMLIITLRTMPLVLMSSGSSYSCRRVLRCRLNAVILLAQFAENVTLL